MYELCNTLGVSRSSYAYWNKEGKRTDESKIAFYQRIIKIYVSSNGIYGAPKITAILNKNGLICSISTVSRSMKLLGIHSIVTEKFKQKKSSLSEEERKNIVNLIKGLQIENINQVWTTDITYIKTAKEGHFYLITYIDLFSKRVVAWDLMRNQRATDMICVLKKAIKARNISPGLIIHSDKGSQMRSNEFRTFLAQKNIIPSYTSLNHSCDENAAQESFHALLKKECIYQNKPINYNEAYAAIYNYIENFYNPIRIHSSIGYMSPIDFENNL